MLKYLEHQAAVQFLLIGIRIPRDFELATDEVTIYREDHRLVIEPVERAGRCVVRPVDALTTAMATAQVVPFACACDDVRNSCSSPGY